VSEAKKLPENLNRVRCSFRVEPVKTDEGKKRRDNSCRRIPKNGKLVACKGKQRSTGKRGRVGRGKQESKLYHGLSGVKLSHQVPEGERVFFGKGSPWKAC